MHRRLSLLLIACLFLPCTALPGRVAAGPASDQQGALAVVATYYQILNAGLRNGNFSAMASVYAPDAMLSRSLPSGDTIVVHGLNQIISYYHQGYLSFPGNQFVRDAWYQLSPNIVLNYEHTVNPAQRQGARCSHLFVLQNGKIKQLFWVAYFAGSR
jgi:hypothetical protein